MVFLFCCFVVYFFVERYGDDRDRHVLTHSFPTRRSSDLDYVAGIRADLAWLGLDIDGEVRQSERFALYEAGFERLKTREELDIRRKIQIGRAHVCTPVTNAHLVCRLLLEKKKNITKQNLSKQRR